MLLEARHEAAARWADIETPAFKSGLASLPRAWPAGIPGCCAGAKPADGPWFAVTLRATPSRGTVEAVPVIRWLSQLD